MEGENLNKFYMADPAGSNNNEDSKREDEEAPEAEPDIGAAPGPEQPRAEGAAEGQQDIFQDEDDFLTADHVTRYDNR